MSIATPELLKKFQKPIPRYTSYPTAPEWDSLSEQNYIEKLQELSSCKTPLSLYFHIPFCKSMCLFCGCSVILNRKPENEEKYVHYLLKELELVGLFLKEKKVVTQLHFGGGTPTKLSEKLLELLFAKIQTKFEIDFSKEVAIEIDPRTVFSDHGTKLYFLKSLGFNRVSFGVQDTNPQVQEAVKRHQSLEMTLYTFNLAKKLGFQGINLDLIYGLPHQTVTSFRKTIEEILKMRPDRIALFSYAKVPWLKEHQKAISDKHLPSSEEKFEIYSEARATLIDNGYVGIGMDHFALETDELAKSYRNKTLQRNFQGYTLQMAEDTLGFGVTSIGYARKLYTQNLKDLSSYYQALDQNTLPVHRGKQLTEEDFLRKWVIHTLMCNFEIDKSIFKRKFGKSFDDHFHSELIPLQALEKDSLLSNTPYKLMVTPLGELFIRIIAATFDAYLKVGTSKFSQAI